MTRQFDMFGEGAPAALPLANPATPRWAPSPAPLGPDGVQSMTEAEVRARSMPHGWLERMGMADVLLFPRADPSASVRRNAIQAFNVYARGLAILAFTPGGVNLLGGHWCADVHDGCPVGAPTRFGESWDELAVRVRWALAQPEWQAPLDEYERLLDAEGAA